MAHKYSFITGFEKTLKNFLVMFAPAFIAFLANVPPGYGALAGFVSYLIKNYLENR